jgi:hypothetical protein
VAGPLCTVEDVEALAGSTVPPADRPRVERLIEFATAVVARACLPLPATVPAEVALVTARLVVRQVANPAGATNESLAGYAVVFSSEGLVLTDEDRTLLGPWADPNAKGGRQGAYSVPTPAAHRWVWPAPVTP